MVQTYAEQLIERGRAEGRAEVQSHAEDLIERGRAEGRAEVQSHAEDLIERGRAEGFAQGRTEAEMQTHRDDLRRLLLRKFQQLPDILVKRIEACTDVERLRTAIVSVLDLQSPEQLEL